MTTIIPMNMGITTTQIATTMLDDFLTRAIIAAVLVVIISAPLGCFVLWRRMAYFGDAISHAALLGVALSLMFSISISVGVLLVCLAVAAIVNQSTSRRTGPDTILGVIAHGALAVALVALSLMPDQRVDLNALLFGDILSVSKLDLGVMAVITLGLLGWLSWRWKPLLLATLSPEHATASGLNAKRETLFLTLALALLVATSIKIIGALLITALLILPAAAARPLAKSPHTMVFTALAIGLIAATTGIIGSLQFNTPTGPSIVVGALVLVLITNGLQRLR
jgi:zinc transport system permease protein